MTTYGEAASAGFGRLVELWGDGSIFTRNIGQGFWHAGNTLHTCINYLLVNRSAAPHRIVEDSLALFEACRDTDPDPARWTKWRDDYGWWGLSLLLAYNNAEQLGLARPERYLQGAYLCWQRLAAAWDADGGGGCWNNPDPTSPERRKNSVTNELLLLLSLELYQTRGAAAEDYRGWASRVREWFAAWRKVGALTDHNGLILETPGKQYQQGWVWTGDQGLYAAGSVKSVDLLEPSTAALSADRYAEASAIVEAVVRTCFADGVLHESDSSDLNFDVDYATGKGVFFRYVADLAFSSNNEHVLTNATAIWNRRPEVGHVDPGQYTFQFGFDWNPGPDGETVAPDGPLWPLTVQTAAQDVLNAAARTAAQAAIPEGCR